jgi:hypothetical protein
MARARILLFPLTFLACVQCTGLTNPLGTAVVQLPSSGWRPGYPSHLAALQGVVQGSASVDGGCVWLESDQGDRDPIAWPAGYYARFDPLRIYDGTGRLEARQGQQIRVGGGLGRAVGFPCMFGHQTAFFIQSGVQVLGGNRIPLVMTILLTGLLLVLLVVLLARKKARRRSLLK